MKPKVTREEEAAPGETPVEGSGWKRKGRARRNPDDGRQAQKNGRTNPRCHREGARTAWKPDRRPEGKERVAKNPRTQKRTVEKTRVGGKKKGAGRGKTRGGARKAKNVEKHGRQAEKGRVRGVKR